MIDSMLYFFVPRVKTFILLDQPHPISDTIHPFVEVYENGRMRDRRRMSPIFYIAKRLGKFVKKLISMYMINITNLWNSTIERSKKGDTIFYIYDYIKFFPKSR